MERGAANTKIVWALGGALIVSLIAVAYLAGKMSAMESAGVVERSPPRELDAPVVPPAVVPTEQDDAPKIAIRDDGEIVIENKAPEPARVDERRPEPAPRAEQPSDSSIDAYFTRMKSIQAGPDNADPKAFAQDLLTVTMSGDYSSFDSLLRSMERAEKEARTVEPPASCAEYHRQLIAHLVEGRQMMSELRDALAKKDPEALAAIGTRASNLQSRLEALERLEARIRAGG